MNDNINRNKKKSLLLMYLKYITNDKIIQLFKQVRFLSLKNMLIERLKNNFDVHDNDIKFNLKLNKALLKLENL